MGVQDENQSGLRSSLCLFISDCVISRGGVVVFNRLEVHYTASWMLLRVYCQNASSTRVDVDQFRLLTVIHCGVPPLRGD